MTVGGRPARVDRPEENADDNVLAGFDLAYDTEGWGVYIEGGAAFDPALTTGSWWDGGPQLVHVDITGDATIYDGLF